MKWRLQCQKSSTWVMLKHRRWTTQWTTPCLQKQLMTVLEFGIILEEGEGRVPARRTAKILVPACPATHLLNVLVHTLPDSKIVEDVHNKIRNDALLNKTRKQTNSTIQSVIENSNVFESRSIWPSSQSQTGIL